MNDNPQAIKALKKRLQSDLSTAQREGDCSLYLDPLQIVTVNGKREEVIITHSLMEELGAYSPCKVNFWKLKGDK